MKLGNPLRKLKQALVRSCLARGPGYTTVGTSNLANRELWLERALQSVPAGSRILDAGAGERQYQRFCRHLKYVSQDFAGYDGVGDQAGLQTKSWDQSNLDIVCDICSVPVPNGSFDAVMCIEVLEHLPDPVAALRELARLLRPGGTLIVTAPFCSLTHFSPHFYATGFSPNFYRYWMKELGLTVAELEPNANYFEYQAQELRRLDDLRQRYETGKFRSIEKAAISAILSLLSHMAKAAPESSELLAYGWHLRAVKR